MQITRQMFEAYLSCRFKCFQYRDGVVGQVTEFSEWHRQTQQRYEAETWSRLCASLPSDATFVGNPALSDLRSHRYNLVGGYEVSTPELQARVNAIQLTGYDAGKDYRQIYVPARFVPREKLSGRDRLCLAFDALALACVCGPIAHVGRIIYGQRHQSVKVSMDKLITAARKTISQIRQHENRNSPPPLILNRHCNECEFQSQCRAVASEHDDLSLLANLSEKEWKQQHDKGIFTVAQLSYTFSATKASDRPFAPTSAHAQGTRNQDSEDPRLWVRRPR